MKKLLTATVAIAMGATLVGALAACKDGGDAKTAQKAIDQIREMYQNEPVETAADYPVLGQTKVDDQFYTVNWSVSSTFENFGNYVSVGEMNETSKIVTVSVTKAEQAIDYTLTASVTVGKETKTTDFTHKVPAKPAAHAGTLEDPYTAANVQDIASKMTPKAKLEESDNPTAVYVKGYIVDCGTDQSDNNRVGYVWIVDEYSDEKDKTATDAVMILSINYGTTLTKYADLERGAEITVKGYIMNYQKAGTTTQQAEVTYYGNNGVTCEAYKKPEKTDDQRLTEELEAAKGAFVKKYVAAGDVTLPTPKESTVTFTWTSGNTDVVTVATDKSKMTIVLPPNETDVTLTLKAEINGAEKQETITFKVGELGLVHAGTEADPFTVEDVFKIYDTVATGKTYQVDGKDQKVYIKGYVIAKGEINWNSKKTDTHGLKNVYLADENGANAKSTLLYSTNWGGAMPKPTTAPTESPLEAGDLIIVSGWLKNYNGEYEIAGNYPEITAWTKKTDTTSDEQRVAAFLATLQNLEDKTTLGNTTLTGTTDAKLTVSWALAAGTDETKVGLSGYKFTVKELPTDADLTVTLTATVTCGTVTQTKDITVVVKAKSGDDPAGGEVELTVAALELGNSSYADGTATVGGIAFQWTELGNYGSGLQWRTKSGKTSTLWNTAALGTKITSLTFVWNSDKDIAAGKTNQLKVEFADNADFTNATTAYASFTTDKTVTVPVPSGNYSFIRVTHNNQGAVYLDSVTIGYTTVTE